MKPPRKYKKTDQKKENNKKRREPSIKKLLELTSCEAIELEPFLEAARGVKSGKNEALWLRRDITAWIDSEEYGSYTKEERLKLLRICKIKMDQIQEATTTTEETVDEGMAQNVPPGSLAFEPEKIIFNAPYDKKHTYNIKVTNSSARRIGYAIKTTNMKRLEVDPPCGVHPKEAVLLAVSRNPFSYGQEDTNNDRITVEWINTPDGAANQFHREWFQGDGMVRRKNLPIEYNPPPPPPSTCQPTSILRR